MRWYDLYSVLMSTASRVLWFAFHLSNGSTLYWLYAPFSKHIVSFRSAIGKLCIEYLCCMLSPASSHQYHQITSSLAASFVLPVASRWSACLIAQRVVSLDLIAT